VANNVVDRDSPSGGKRVRRGSELVNLRLASWNIMSLMGKSIKLVKGLRRCKII